MEIWNLEMGMPSGDEALQLLERKLSDFYMTNSRRLKKEKVVKIIHGYGSSGRGGVIKTVVRKRLETLKRKGDIDEICHGENFSFLYKECKKIYEKDSNLIAEVGKYNKGVTYILIE